MTVAGAAASPLSSGQLAQIREIVNRPQLAADIYNGPWRQPNELDNYGREDFQMRRD